MMEEEQVRKQKPVVISEFSIFKPKSTRALYDDYPELKTHMELKSLTRFELLFIWYYACEASPLFKITSNRDRASEAMNLTFFSNKQKRLSDEDKERYLNGKFPEKLKAAIEVMERFRIGPRVRAKMILEKGFENLEHILNIDASNDENFKNAQGEVDQSKKKSYVDTLDKAVSLLPNLINTLESGFGVNQKSKGGKDDDTEESFMDAFHEQN
jgi:hypothetical protein